MTSRGIPEHVQRFVREHIDSVEQLDVLLLLFRTSPREWSAVAVSRELRIDPVSAARRLDDFHARELLTVRAGDEALLYSYVRGGPNDEAIADLATAYAERRTTLIQFIFEAPSRDVRVFADAFRLRKKDKDRGNE
ncbi:MAG: hypothetical protein AB1689_25640 [Thermodesulfobacteriota bacterium]